MGAFERRSEEGGVTGLANGSARTSWQERRVATEKRISALRQKDAIGSQRGAERAIGVPDAPHGLCFIIA